jgi:hypothetical protein
MRRDMHETLSRLVENTVQTAGRAPDSSGWLRKGVRDGVLGGPSEASTFSRERVLTARSVSTDDDSAQDDARKEDEKSSVGEMEKPAADRSKAADANQVKHFSAFWSRWRTDGVPAPRLPTFSASTFFQTLTRCRSSPNVLPPSAQTSSTTSSRPP